MFKWWEVVQRVHLHQVQIFSKGSEGWNSQFRYLGTSDSALLLLLLFFYRNEVSKIVEVGEKLKDIHQKQVFELSKKNGHSQNNCCGIPLCLSRQYRCENYKI